MPVIADTYRCAFEWSNDASLTAVNVMHFRGHPGSQSDLRSKLVANVNDGLYGAIQEDFHIANLKITPLDGVTAGTDGDDLTAVFGRATGQPVLQCAAIVKFTTGIAGRSFRGRQYLGPMGESQADAGFFFEATRASDEGSWQTFVTDMSGDGYDLVVASYTAEIATDVSAVSVEQPLATQRRRQSRLR